MVMRRPFAAVKAQHLLLSAIYLPKYMNADALVPLQTAVLDAKLEPTLFALAMRADSD
jgi:hypothetical protein